MERQVGMETVRAEITTGSRILGGGVGGSYQAGFCQGVAGVGPHGSVGVRTQKAERVGGAHITERGGLLGSGLATTHKCRGVETFLSKIHLARVLARFSCLFKFFYFVIPQGLGLQQPARDWGGMYPL